MVESSVSFVIGILIVALTAYDFFYTTISFNGAGFISKFLTGTLSSFFLFLNEHTSGRTVLKFSGISQVLATLFLWVSLLWSGLFFILSSSSTSIVHSISRKPADLVNIFYFSGYTLSTLGLGDFVPGDEIWQIVVAVFSFSGFIFLTTGMSYLLNLTSAVLRKRSLSGYISNLGDSPEEIVINTYSEGSFERLTRQVSTLQEKINKHTQSHFAYPISHYFYSTSRSESLAITLINLDEALTIIKHDVIKDESVETDLRPLRNAIDQFLETLQSSFISKLEAQKEVTPDIDELSTQGIPIVSEPTTDKEESSISERRLLLIGLLKSSGWSWDDIYR